MLRAGSQEDKRNSRSLDLEQCNAKRHVHYRSASESGFVVESRPIEKQVPKVVSFYKKLSSSTDNRFKKSRTSVGLALSNLFPKQNEINQFSIDGFAQKYFATHKRGLFRRRVPVKDMLRWTKDSIRQPLLNDLGHKREALECFKVLQIWMGDRTKPRHYDLMQHIQTLLDCGISKGPMRDEIYVQICRQLNKNPKRESVQKGWQIMSVVAITFPPSKNLESYLIDFVKQYSIDPLMMQYILTKLERICLKGARGKTLSVAEIERAMVMIFLTDAVKALDGKRTQGIFRVPGDADIVTDLRVRIENGNYDTTGIHDPNVPASLLKYWLRDLSEPLIPFYLYQQCIEYASEGHQVVKIINSLPDHNRRILLYMTHFIQEFIEPQVVQHTLMTVSNLAMVFAPNYFKCPSSHLPTLFENSKHEQTFVRTLISLSNLDKNTLTYGEHVVIK
ncbi:hypothetical protein G6F56_004205 [Rhizopus delemar]|nr:hypothetical protein G6F56_004205 [Rhizopus delemar]